MEYRKRGRREDRTSTAAVGRTPLFAGPHADLGRPSLKGKPPASRTADQAVIGPRQSHFSQPGRPIDPQRQAAYAGIRVRFAPLLFDPLGVPKAGKAGRQNVDRRRRKDTAFRRSPRRPRAAIPQGKASRVTHCRSFSLSFPLCQKPFDPSSRSSLMTPALVSSPRHCRFPEPPVTRIKFLRTFS